MWWNVGDKVRQSVRNSHKVAQQEGKPSKNLETFVAKMNEKFGSLTRAWRLGIDMDGSGQVTFREFCSALKDVGYVGSLKTLWYELDTDASGFITLNEIDHVSAAKLEKFRALCTTRFGSMEKAWQSAIDTDRSGTVSLPEFLVATRERLGYQSDAEIEDLFTVLKEPHSRFIGFKEIAFLQEWENTKMENEARKRHGKRWVNKDPYFQVSSQLARVQDLITGNNQARDERRYASSDDGEEIDYANMIAFDEKAAWKDFREFLLQRYGSLPKAFDSMDANATGMLSMVEFQTAVCGSLRYCRAADAKRLFMSAVGNDGMMSFEELGITRQEWIVHDTGKKQAALAKANASKLGKAGPRARAKSAETKHCGRIRNPKSRAVLAFNMPLPRGWGFPPTFDLRNSRRAKVQAFDDF